MNRAPAGFAALLMFLALVASTGPRAAHGATESPASADDAAPSIPRSGTVPAAAPDLLLGLDSRLVGAPLAPGPSAEAAAVMAKAEHEEAAFAAELATLDARRVALGPSRADADAALATASSNTERARQRMHTLVASVYVRADTQSSEEADLGRAQVLAARVQRDIVAEWRRATEARDRARAELDAIDAEIAKIDAAHAIATAGQADARARIQAAAADVQRLLPAATVADLDIPLVSLDAYLRAERAMAAEAPSCAIPWYAIAGIAVNESNHGRFRGSTPDATGRVEPAIVGIPLNGDGVAAIGDTDGGLYDGDAQWDRAVGPMQFIPGTWNAWKSDGNLDGVTDPQNIYDAALGAARYLCRGAQPFGFNDRGAANNAFLSYNRAQWYADKVFTRAKQFAQWGLPSTGPMSPTWSTLPESGS